MPTPVQASAADNVPPTTAGPSIDLSRRDWMIAVVVALVAVALRLPVAENRGIWYDEYRTMSTFGMSLVQMADERIGAGHSPLYFLYARLGPLMGPSAWHLRVPTVLLVALTILFLTGLMGAVGLRRCLPALWGIAVLEPSWLWLGVQMRYMMAVVAVGALTLWLLIRFAESATTGRRRALTIAAVTLSWIHPTAALIVLGGAVFLAWEGRIALGRWTAKPVMRRAQPMIIAVCASLLLLLVINRKDPVPGAVEVAGTIASLLEAVFGENNLWPRILGLSRTPFLVVQGLLLLSAFFLARREFRLDGGEREARFWRLLVTLIAGISLVFLLACLWGRNFRSSRYVACFSLPMVIVMAVAWNAQANRLWTSSYRIGLAVVLAMQATGMLLERGDPHREACQWIIANHADAEPVIISPQVVNTVGLVHFGLTPTNCIVTTRHLRRNKGVAATQTEIENLATEIQDSLGSANRGFFIWYNGHRQMFEALDVLKQRGVLVGARYWKVTSNLAWGAIISDASQQSWLSRLPVPEIVEQSSPAQQ